MPGADSPVDRKQEKASLMLMADDAPYNHRCQTINTLACCPALAQAMVASAIKITEGNALSTLIMLLACSRQDAAWLLYCLSFVEFARTI